MRSKKVAGEAIKKTLSKKRISIRPEERNNTDLADTRNIFAISWSGNDDSKKVTWDVKSSNQIEEQSCHRK